MRLDLHIHSNYSDGRARVEDILKMARRRGLGGVAITDHDTLRGSQVARRASRVLRRDLVVIMGAEISTSEGHLLALGIEELPPLRHSPEETIDAIHDLGGIAVVPHPYHYFRHGMGRIPPVDAVEVFNSRYILGLSNVRARREATSRGLPMVAGSDSHMLETVGLGVTVVNADSSGQALEEIRQGRTGIICKRTPSRMIARNVIKSVRRKIGKRLQV
ncbi:MAG: PHP domain-containing protein [Methanosarcinales archaeon]|nr:PHP domain-containing protein [Methanosarcinales archaeon]